MAGSGGGWQELAESLSAAIAHRGPDGAGVWSSPGRDVLLVHRRLAIIDPRPEANQPMASADGRFVLVFNGEIYNHGELRAELEARGERFRTASDTEVLLRLIEREGPASLERLRGMFALACWNAADRAMLLARDRFGIKPLYLVQSAGRLAFASELGALTGAKLVDRRPSAAGMIAFLRWGSVPGPLTWIAGAEALRPGTWRLWRQDGRHTDGMFADARQVYRAASSGVSAEVLRERVGAAVRDSVRAHLVADVPVGVFLSGGIDSSALVSASASLGAANLQTFTVGFDDRSSEADRARGVAAHFGTRHAELTVDAAAIERDLPAIVRRLDQPTIDAINSYCVSKAVASAGIKAVLSGAGGDEVFGGYSTFTRVPRALAAKRALGRWWPMIAPVGRLAVPARAAARWRHFATTNGSLVDAYRVARGLFMPHELRELAGPALVDANSADRLAEVAAVEADWLSPAGPEPPAAAIARLETRLYLGSQLLRDIDVMGMAHGLEVRVPFVDHRLVAAVWPALASHPSLMKGKRLLYDSLERPLPDEVIRHRKQGFTLPFATWIDGGLAPFVRDGLEQLAASGWLQRSAPDRVWTDWQAGRSHWSRPWGLAVLGHFLGDDRTA
jgi:asparagine synthase (glutamine-hydrolysing)